MVAITVFLSVPVGFVVVAVGRFLGLLLLVTSDLMSLSVLLASVSFRLHAVRVHSSTNASRLWGLPLQELLCLMQYSKVRRRFRQLTLFMLQTVTAGNLICEAEQDARYIEIYIEKHN